MKYFSAFTGVGGFDIALNKLGFECVGHSENNRYSSMVLKYNYPNIINYGDITILNPNKLPDFDLFVGGFPCQAFSIAGKRKGFADTRGTLFFDICRILRYKRPKHILLENVKGLLNHEGGNTFYTILKHLDELGYDVIWQVCNAKDFGIPQNRERVFIIGYLRNECRPKVFYVTKDDKLPDNIQGQVSPTITASYGKMGQSNPFLIVERAPLKFLGRNQKNISGDYAYTVDTLNTGGININGRIRKFTPLECERLMGFPDNWTKYGIDLLGNTVLMSDSQRYKQCGNGVVSNVVYEIAKQLFV